MLGDGKTEYDQEHDGEGSSIGACSVSIGLLAALESAHLWC